MHILQLLPSLEVGGVERGVLDLAKGLIARGHRVSVVSSGGALVDRLTQLGAMHHRLPVHEKSLTAMWACLPAVTRLIASTGVDVVHARSRVPGWIGFVAARRTQRPFVTTAHGFYQPHLGSRVMVWGRFVIAPSEALGRYLVERFQLPKERLRVIPRGVDLEEFAFQPPPIHEGPWRIGLFGRLSPIKGQAIALRACERLLQKRIPVKLCLAGDAPGSPGRVALESLIARLKLGEAVEWLGVRQDIAALIASMDLIVVPSTYPESFGRGVIEAQAVGRPVVASRLGALADLVEDGTSGLLVRPGDPLALAQALERLIQDPSLRMRCVETGRTRVEAHCGVDRMVEETLNVYQECLTRPRILVWKLSALGDVILSIPSLRALRRQFPEGRITLAVGRFAYEVVARCPYLDDILIYDPIRKDRGIVRHLAFVKRLRQGRFDWSIDLQNSRKTHLMAWSAGIPLRLGYRRKLGWLLNRPVRLPRVVLTPIAHQFYLLRHVLPPQHGAGGPHVFSTDGIADRLELWPSPLDDERAQRLLDPVAGGPRQGLVGIHPGGSGRWKTKRWDLGRWAQLCNGLAKRNIRVVVIGGREEQALGEALKRLVPPPVFGPEGRSPLPGRWPRLPAGQTGGGTPLNLIGQTSLMELACLIKRCDVFVAHDSSSLHVAAAVGTPTIALFGPTDPPRHLPPTFTGRVITKDVFCRPCYSTRCRTITHACMQRITTEEVLQTVLGQLAESPHDRAEYGTGLAELGAVTPNPEPRTPNPELTMKILQLTSHLNVGGVTSYVLSLSQALHQRGHEVIVASGGGQREGAVDALGLEHWRLPLHTSAEFSPQVFSAARALAARLRAHPVDVLHAHTRVSQVVAEWLSRRLGTPYVTTWHGFFRPNLGRTLWPCLGHRTIAISEPVRAHLVRDFRVPERRVRLIPHGIDPTPFEIPVEPRLQTQLREQVRLPSDGPVLGTVARLVPSKGVDQLILSLPQIRASVPDARLLIVGDGEDRPRLERIAAGCGLAQAVHFAGALPETRVALSLMDVVVFLPAEQEGFGLSLLEAMACGRPLVAVRRGAGAPWVLDQSGIGAVVEPGELGALADAITTFLTSDERSRRAAEQARAVVKERFPLSRMVDQVEAVYRELVVRRSSIVAREGR